MEHKTCIVTFYVINGTKKTILFSASVQLSQNSCSLSKFITEISAKCSQKKKKAACTVSPYCTVMADMYIIDFYYILFCVSSVLCDSGLIHTLYLLLLIILVFI